MSSGFFKIKNGVNLGSLAADPVDADVKDGDFYYNSVGLKFRLRVNGAFRDAVSADDTQTLTNKTLTGNIAVSLMNGAAVISLPSATTTLVGRDTTDTLTNKTLTGNTAANLVNGVATVSLPSATTTLVGRDTTDTLTNKTLTGNTAANLVNGAATVSLPSATTTLVGKDTTDTLTNKSIDAATNTIANIADANIKAAAAIALNKLAAATPSKALASDASGFVTASAVTSTELGQLSGVTSPVQTQLNTGATNLSNHIGNASGAHAASAISNTPSGNIASTTVQAALNEVQTHVDTDVTNLATHKTTTSGTHGVVGNIVGTSDTQSLTNKTISDSLTLAQVATPATPAAGLNKFYAKSDGKLYTLTPAGVETAVGSGSGGGTTVNVIGASSDWTTYSLTIGATVTAPTPGTTSTNVARYRRVGDSMEIEFQFEQTSAGSQGSGAYLFPLPAGLSIDTTKLSVGASDGPFTCGSAMIRDAAASSNGFRPAIVSAYNSNNLAIITYASGSLNGYYGQAFGGLANTAQALSFTAKVPIQGWTSSVDVSNYTTVTTLAANISDWKSYSLSIGATTTAPTKGTATTDIAVWRRVGDSMEIRYNYVQTAAGSPGSGTYLFPLPTGYQIDSTKIGLGGNGITNSVGLGTVTDGSSQGVGDMWAYDSTHLAMRGVSTPSGSAFTVQSSQFSTATTAVNYSFSATVPISGWSSADATSTLKGLAGSDTLSYTPTFTGLGSVTSTDAFYSRIGDQIYVQMRFTTGTTTATEARVTLPPGMVVDSSKLPNIRLVGHAAFGAAAQGSNTGGTTVMDVLAEPGASYFTFSIQNTINSGLTKTTGSNGFPSNTPTSFFAQIPIAGFSSNITIGNSSTFKISSYLASGSRVTTTPTTLGSYRAYQQNANASTGSDATPGTLPNAVDGIRIDTYAYNTAGSGAGNISRYEIFVGKGKNVRPRYYLNPGRQGTIFTDFTVAYNGANNVQEGVFFQYDETTGVATFDTIARDQNTTTNRAGRTLGSNGSSNGIITTVYADLVVSDNALAVGIDAPRSELRFHTRAGLGSTNTYSPYYSTVDISTGTAFSYSNSSVTGLVVTVLEDGLYNVEAAAVESGATQGGIAVSKNYSTNTQAGSVPPGSRLFLHDTLSASATAIGVSGSRTTFLSAGTTLRPHIASTAGSAVASFEEFAITKVSN